MKYGALTIDTSVFDHYGLSLDTEPLKSLDQFKGKPVGIVLCDVVVRELSGHLTKKVEDQAKAVAKAARVARALKFDSKLVEALDHATAAVDAEQVSAEQLRAFLEATGADELRSVDHVRVDDLLTKYFHAAPPFASSGSKKSEFPDAICLMALESFAKGSSVKILAVSRDQDWVEFAEGSEWVDVEKDLSEALVHFQAQTDAYKFCHNLASNWSSSEYEYLRDEIHSGIQHDVEGWNFHVDAESALSWEPNDLSVTLDRIELIESGDLTRDIKIINLDEDVVTFKFNAALFFSVEADFSLSIYDSIDKDYTYLGGCASRAEPEVVAEVFVRVSGDLNGALKEMDVETVDATPVGQLVADFGYLEPDWHEDDYD
jgi:hypothetical protein